MDGTLSELFSTWHFGFFFLALGLCIGSFLNVCIYRLPAGKSLVWPGSHCTSCEAPIAWYDNIPVASYFILGGRCRKCGAKFSARYMLVELATVVRAESATALSAVPVVQAATSLLMRVPSTCPTT